MLLPVSELLRFGVERAFVADGVTHRLAAFGLVERSLCRQTMRRNQPILSAEEVDCLACRLFEGCPSVPVETKTGEIRHRASIKLRDKDTGRVVRGCFAS